MTLATERPDSTTALSVPEAIQTRRSIRKYQPEPIPAADLQEILRLASLAPTANNLQPTRFVVIQNPELQAKLQAAAYNQAQITSAPAVIVVYSDMEDVLSDLESVIHPGVGQEQVKARAEGLSGNFSAQSIDERGRWGLAQANITFGFLMLAARSLGYDTNPMLGFQADQVRDLLNLPPHVQFAGLLPIGKRAEEGFPHHRHSVERVTRWD